MGGSIRSRVCLNRHPDTGGGTAVKCSHHIVQCGPWNVGAGNIRFLSALLRTVVAALVVLYSGFHVLFAPRGLSWMVLPKELLPSTASRSGAAGGCGRPRGFKVVCGTADFLLPGDDPCRMLYDCSAVVAVRIGCHFLPTDPGGGVPCHLRVKSISRMDGDWPLSGSPLPAGCPDCGDRIRAGKYIFTAIAAPPPGIFTPIH